MRRWIDRVRSDECIAWTRELFDSLRPHLAGEAYVNYLDADDSSRVPAAYGPHDNRLRAVKRRYDPDNIFHHQNIVPGGEVELRCP